jgi:hypothetical protein
MNICKHSLASILKFILRGIPIALQSLLLSQLEPVTRLNSVSTASLGKKKTHITTCFLVRQFHLPKSAIFWQISF